ncbi:MAG: hypothetical protein VZS44_10815 [Bacilli bacterium]|nr:hypothetical protein [Bacilli bacterium]
MNWELEKLALNHFKNSVILSSTKYSVTLQSKIEKKEDKNKVFVVMKSYFMNI